MRAGREANAEGSARRRPVPSPGAGVRSGARRRCASTAGMFGPLGVMLAGLALAVLPPAADAGPKPRYPALQPAPGGSTTQGPPKGGAQTQDTEPCGTVPCALAAPPRQVLAFDDPRAPLPHVKPVADTGPAQVPPNQSSRDPARVAWLREVFARADPLPGRRIGVSVGFCVARPKGQEKPAPVRLALAEARAGSGDAGQASRPRMRSLLELRFVWRAVGTTVGVERKVGETSQVEPKDGETAEGLPKDGKTAAGLPIDCYVGAQAYRRRPELLELRGLEPRSPDGLQIQNAFEITVLKSEPEPEPKPEPKPGQTPYQTPGQTPGKTPTGR